MLTQSVAVRGHGRHGGPHFAVGVVALGHVGGLQAVPSSHHVQLVVDHRHPELEPAAVHGAHLDPRVGAQVVLLYGGGAWGGGGETVPRVVRYYWCRFIGT